jgi:hypothetical protein
MSLSSSRCSGSVGELENSGIRCSWKLRACSDSACTRRPRQPMASLRLASLRLATRVITSSSRAAPRPWPSWRWPPQVGQQGDGLGITHHPGGQRDRYEPQCESSQQAPVQRLLTLRVRAAYAPLNRSIRNQPAGLFPRVPPQRRGCCPSHIRVRTRHRQRFPACADQATQHDGAAGSANHALPSPTAALRACKIAMIRFPLPESQHDRDVRSGRRPGPPGRPRGCG